MKIKNIDLLAVKNALASLLDQPIKGGAKFDLMRTVLQVDDAMEPVIKSLDVMDDGKVLNNDNNQEILEREQEVEISPLSKKLIESMEISTRALMVLRPIIKEESNAE